MGRNRSWLPHSNLESGARSGIRCNEKGARQSPYLGDHSGSRYGPCTLRDLLERKRRLELATSSLARRCSTTELHPQFRQSAESNNVQWPKLRKSHYRLSLLSRNRALLDFLFLPESKRIEHEHEQEHDYELREQGCEI